MHYKDYYKVFTYSETMSLKNVCHIGMVTVVEINYEFQDKNKIC